ncbi:MAG: hypothetical protein HUJ61_08030 [Bacilli bacterium]|nr:hypothetical protein [Bacilli bacterium]
MAKLKGGKDYFGLPRIVSVILWLFGIGAILGIVQRFLEGKIVAGILRILFGWNIVYLVDLILLILKGRIWRAINC